MIQIYFNQVLEISKEKLVLGLIKNLKKGQQANKTKFLTISLKESISDSNFSPLIRKIQR